MAELEIRTTTLKVDLTGPQITRVLAILTADQRRAQQEDVAEGPWPQAVTRLRDAFGGYRRTDRLGATLKLTLTGYEIAVLTGLLSITIDRHEREHPGATDSMVRDICDQVIGYRSQRSWSFTAQPPPNSAVAGRGICLPPTEKGERCMPYFGDEEASAERVKRYLKDNCRDEDGTALSDARLTELVTDHQPILDRGVRSGWFASYTAAKVADEAGLLWGNVDKRTAAEVADYTALAAMVQRELPGFRAEAIADPNDGQASLPIRRLRAVHDGWGYTAVIRIVYAHDSGLHIRLWRPTENVSPHCGSCQCGDDELSFAYQLFDLTGPQPRRFFRRWLDGVTHLGAHAAGEHARDQCPGDPGPDCTVCPNLAAEHVMP